MCAFTLLRVWQLLGLKSDTFEKDAEGSFGSYCCCVSDRYILVVPWSIYGTTQKDYALLPPGCLA